MRPHPPSSPGWNDNALKATSSPPTNVAGSLCYDGKRACRNNPTAAQALLKAAKVEPMFSIAFDQDPNANGARAAGGSRVARAGARGSGCPLAREMAQPQHASARRRRAARSTHPLPVQPRPPPPAAGGVGTGQILMGGVDATLIGGKPFIPTPLAPNLWRTDFKTGKDKYVFWQFTPLSIAIMFADGAVRTLCAEADVSSKDACTVIADTGYGTNVAGDATTLQYLKDATAPGGPKCAATLEVSLPTQKGGWAPRTLSIPLTAGASGNWWVATRRGASRLAAAHGPPPRPARPPHPLPR
jgi:hypothetical protein